MDQRSEISRGADSISIIELRRLLIDIKEHRPDIAIRFRLLGQMWLKNFMNIFIVSESGIVMVDPQTKAAEIIPDVSHIIQFEIESKFQVYQPNYHYTVDPFVRY
jgi:hypothetical protein